MFLEAFLDYFDIKKYKVDLVAFFNSDLTIQWKQYKNIWSEGGKTNIYIFFNLIDFIPIFDYD